MMRIAQAKHEELARRQLPRSHKPEQSRMSSNVAMNKRKSLKVGVSNGFDCLLQDKRTASSSRPEDATTRVRARQVKNDRSLMSQAREVMTSKEVRAQQAHDMALSGHEPFTQGLTRAQCRSHT
eukprot:5603560-Amphidinium_carterae.1